ncbi:MAG: hypothetical protein ABWZ98_18140 [Nakamurella sp.]
MSRQRTVTVVVLALLLSLAACTGDAAGPVQSSATDLPYKEQPIAGLNAPDVIAAARAVLPGATELNTPGELAGYRPYARVSFGYPNSGSYGPDILGSAPGITIGYEADGGVSYVGCADLAATVPSSALSFCTGLTIPGVPADGLSSVLQSAIAGNWDHTQPFDSVNVDYSEFDGTHPQPGPALLFGITAPESPGPKITNSTSL